MKKERIDFETIESVNVDALNNILHDHLMKDSPLNFSGENGEILEAKTFEDFDKLMSDKTTTFIL